MPGVTLNPDWQHQRNLLNHNWLKNQFLMHLDSLLNTLGGPVHDEEFVQEFCDSILPAWNAQCEKICKLVDRFEQDMSPQLLCVSQPITQHMTPSKQWLAVLVHMLWLARYPVKKWVADAHICAGRAKSLYSDLCKALDNDALENPEQRLAKHRELLMDFRRQCELLSQALSRFPHRILVI